MMRKVMMLVAGVSLAVSGVFAKTCTWQVASGFASEAANWDGGVPSAADDAVMTGGVMTVNAD